MHSGILSLRMDRKVKRTWRGIVIGGMMIVGCAMLFAMRVSAAADVDFSNMQAVPYSSTTTPFKAGNISENAQSTIAPPAAAPAAPEANSIYVARYLPDILKGAKGPGDMVFLIYEYLMGLVGIVAVGVIMYGGVLRTMSADPSKVRQSTEYIKNALKGIVLLFGAQVLFNTINPNIVNVERINQILQPSERIVTRGITGVTVGFEETGSSTLRGTDVRGGASSFGYIPTLPAGTATAADARRVLSSVKGVTLPNECAPGGSTRGCVSLQGVQSETLSAMMLMAQAGVPVRVTSVTEGAHAAGDYSHANGYKWDMKPIDPKFFADKPDQFQKIATRSDSSATYRDKATGAECSLEVKTPHWDCSVRPDIKL